MSNTDVLRQIGEAIRSSREAAGLSQEQLGELAELHRNEIGVIERGEVNVSMVNFLRVCRGLQVDPSKLLLKLRLSDLQNLPPKRVSGRRER